MVPYHFGMEHRMDNPLRQNVWEQQCIMTLRCVGADVACACGGVLPTVGKSRLSGCLFYPAVPSNWIDHRIAPGGGRNERRAEE